MNKTSQPFSWKSLFAVTFLIAMLYILLEWLFIMTKPSFLSTSPLLEKVKVLIFASTFLTGLCFIIFSLVYAASLLLYFRKGRAVFLSLGMLLPVAIISSLVLLLVDNFTYTVFSFGIVSTRGLSKALYALSFLLAFLFFYLRVARLLSRLSSKIECWRLKPLAIPVFTALVGLGLILTNNWNNIPDLPVDSSFQQGGKRYPNIILITADGVDADRTSLYGYERDNTPRIRNLAASSLVAQNAFTNSGNTAGSLISIYTSKHPTTLRLLYPPDILKGLDSYQHLPGILKSLGYINAQFATPYYADAFDQNMLSGFDVANGRSVQYNGLFSALNKVVQMNNAYFIYETSKRITDRLKHIFFIKQMPDLQNLVEGTQFDEKDREKIDNVLKLFDQNDRPVFVHVHWLGTHGAQFSPQKQVFSIGKEVESQTDWDDDFYDDSLLDFDSGVGQIIDGLKDKGLYDNTILVIGSDHNQKYLTTKRVPLLIHFPGGQYAGKIVSNAQNLDIAPTLLDYLGLSQPDWMAGESLLDGVRDDRPIFGVSNSEKSDPQSPPFYQFGNISLIYCDNWYQLDLNKEQWSSGKVEGYTGFCREDSVLSNEQAFSWMLGRLMADGFDTVELSDFSAETKK